MKAKSWITESGVQQGRCLHCHAALYWSGYLQGLTDGHGHADCPRRADGQSHVQGES